MQVSNWWENIPKNGVLCKDDSGDLQVITSAKGIFGFRGLDYGYPLSKLTPLTAAEIMAFLPDIKPVAWAVGRDNKVSVLSAIYPSKISAQNHVDSYKDDPDFSDIEMQVIELYQLPSGDL